MNKRTSSVEWTIAESDAEWEGLQAPPLSERVPSPNPRRLQPYFWAVGVLLLWLVGVGDWWWRTAQAGAPPTPADMTATAQPKQEAAAPNVDSLVASVIGDLTATEAKPLVIQAESSLRVALQNNAPAAHVDIAAPRIEFHGNRAVANILTTSQDGVALYRQTRFYRRTSTGWLRMEPDAALWGPERRLETPYFAYHFRQNDAAAVVAVAPQVDALYRIMRRNFGLPLAPTPEKLVVLVSITQTPADTLAWYRLPGPLTVPSPAVYLAPVEVTDAELLEQSIALPLLNYVLAQASKQHAVRANWQLLLRGLYLWQVWDLDLPLAAWRKDVVKWLYVDLPGAGPGQSIVLPEHYPALCATYRLWMPSPMQINIPLICATPEWEEQSFPLWRLRDPLTRLDQLSLPVRPNEQGTNRGYLPQLQLSTRPVALATLIEYAVATYGRERLPALVAGLGQYDSWETLLPAVYGVSSAEFEVGWQAYLKAHYGIISAN